MIIDFKNMEEQILPNFKGGEKSYAVKKFTDVLKAVRQSDFTLTRATAKCSTSSREQAKCLWTASMKGLRQVCATIAR